MTDIPLWQQRQTAVLALERCLNSEHFSTGDRAALRRMTPDALNRPAFWRLLMDPDILPESIRDSVSESRWAMLLHGMAVTGAPHRQGATLGRVLAGMGLGEPRLEQFLRAREDQIWPHLRRLFQMLARHAEPLDWISVADFLLIADETEQEKQRRRIARDFYSAKAATKDAQKD
jgi:CRISPR system Cascade subunit CasB